MQEKCHYCVRKAGGKKGKIVMFEGKPIHEACLAELKTLRLYNVSKNGKH